MTSVTEKLHYMYLLFTCPYVSYTGSSVLHQLLKKTKEKTEVPGENPSEPRENIQTEHANRQLLWQLPSVVRD